MFLDDIVDESPSTYQSDIARDAEYSQPGLFDLYISSARAQLDLCEAWITGSKSNGVNVALG